MHPALEATLVRRLRAGEGGAFDVVFDHYRGRVFGFLVRLARRRDVAEDLTQETFLRLADRRTELAEDSRLGPWLFTVARNLWASHGRRQALEGEGLEALAFADERAAPPTPHELAVASEAQRRLETALGALPEAQREVVLLVVIERFEPSAAASILGLSPEAVRQRLARARAELGAALAEPEIPTRGRGGVR